MSGLNFGLLEVDVSATSKMPLVLPGEVDPVVDEQGQEGYLEFLPWDSEEGRKVERDMQRTNVRKGFRLKSAAELRREAEDEDPVDDQVKRIVALITGWHLVGPDKKVIDVAFSKDNAVELFSSPKMAWLRRRAFTYINNERNFMKSGSARS